MMRTQKKTGKWTKTVVPMEVMVVVAAVYAAGCRGERGSSAPSLYNVTR